MKWDLLKPDWVEGSAFVFCLVLLVWGIAWIRQDRRRSSWTEPKSEAAKKGEAAVRQKARENLPPGRQ